MVKWYYRIMTIILSIWTVLLTFFTFSPKPAPVNPDEPEYKNVILMIGDGMGFNSINKAVQELELKKYNLQRMEYQGESKTRSANNSVTDSAAGGTALACGVKTNNNALGVYPDDLKAEESYPENISEHFLKMGKSAGIVTTDNNYGATPAAFSVHVKSRKSYDEITENQLQSDLNLIWSYKSSDTLKKDISGAGFQLIKTFSDMAVATSYQRTFAQFEHSIWHSYDYKSMPSLAQISAKAIDILDDDEDGFFLMIEGAHIDKNSHNNESEKMCDAFKSFDDAVGTVTDYASTHKGTVVIVTADHETGGIKYDEDSSSYVYTTGNHTGVNVPLFVYGTDKIIKSGEIVENTEIPIRAVRLFNDKDFPKKIKK